MVSRALEEQNPVLLHNPGGHKDERCWYGTREHVQLLELPAEAAPFCRGVQEGRRVPSLPLPPPEFGSKHFVVQHRRQGFKEWKAGMWEGRWEHSRKEFDQGTRNGTGKQDSSRIQTQSSLKMRWMWYLLLQFQFLGTRPTHLDRGQRKKNT